jgi:hypothetical protein
MGHFRGDSQRDMGFPDEFGEDMCQEKREQPAPSGNTGPTPPFCGYVTPSWFGPFLLSPPNRRERGFC